VCWGSLDWQVEYAMNFSPFGVGVPLSAALPVATQFSAGKITQSVTTPNGQVVGVLQGGENGVHYIRPLDANAFATATTQGQNAGQTQTLITLPITMPGAKPGDPQQHVQIQVVNPVQTQVPQSFGQGATVLTVAYNANQEGIQIVDGQNGIAEGMTVVAALQPQDIQLLQAEPEKTNKEVTPVALIKSEMSSNKDDENNEAGTSITAIPAQYLQNASVQEYLQKMQQHSTLPLSLQQFLKFNNPEIKREQITEEGVIETINITQEDQEQLILNEVEGEMETEENVDDPDKGKKKKKYKKKPPKPKKPKPGQVHIATALDGTTLFCCPECHMAYPEKELLEQHLIGHKIERRFICDICGAGLKRKEHLERHKLGHNPERPFVCSVCMKGFKRKEHLNLHFVIHSGEKTEICGECGKGFYRKDHLRKHARSHITRRAKEQAERNQNILIKEPTTQVTIQVPTSQMQIPVQIQVPQHHIQVTANSEEDGNQVSTVVLPTATEGIILPQN
jgi:uncharacterized Zn-finger protein